MISDTQLDVERVEAAEEVLDAVLRGGAIVEPDGTGGRATDRTPLIALPALTGNF